MNPLLLLGGGVVIFFVMSKNARSKNAGGPSVNYPNGKVATIPQNTKSPSSAQARRADQGNGANQPWYDGAVKNAGTAAGTALATVGIAAAGAALAKGISAIGDLFKGNDGPEVTDDDISFPGTGDACSNNEAYSDDDKTFAVVTGEVNSSSVPSPEF